MIASNIKLHQINIVDKEVEFKYFTKLKENGVFIIGIEVTDHELVKECDLSIDPQHNFNDKSNITATEFIFNNQYDILNKIHNKNICLTTVRPDTDSIASMALLSMLLKDEFKLDGDIILRLKAIAKSDRHGRQNWKNKKEDYFHFENFNTYGLPSGLPYMCSDHKLSIDRKVRYMIQYLKNGSFDELQKYNSLVLRNLKRSNESTKIQIIIPEKLSFVESKHRGAIAYGYKYTPIVVARNPQFTFGMGELQKTGIKWTIGQYEDNKYIDMSKLLDDLNLLESGWGGSSSILGSRLNSPSEIIDEEIIIKTVIKYIREN